MDQENTVIGGAGQSEIPRFMTTREACDRLGYSRPDSFLRAWRAAGLPLDQRPGGQYLVEWHDIGKFLKAEG